MRIISILLASSLVLLGAGCADNTSAPSSAADLPLSDAAGDHSTAATVPEAPPPPGSTAPSREIVDTYLSLIGGNVSGGLAVPLPAGGECHLRYGGTLAPLTPADASGQIQVRYSFQYPPVAGYCPSGIEFQLPEAHLKAMATETKVIDETFRAQIETVARLSQSQQPQATDEKPAWGSVRVMNLEPVSNGEHAFGFWTMCSLYDLKTGLIRGNFEKLLKTQWGTLARLASYPSEAQPISGGDCPVGTIIILEGQQISQIQSGGIQQKIMPYLSHFDQILPLP